MIKKVGVYNLKKLMGHKKITTTEGYIISIPEEILKNCDQILVEEDKEGKEER